MEQAEHIRSRLTDPETSHAAAEAAAKFAAAHCDAIIDALKEGPAGKTLIARRSGIDDVAVARRMPELQRLGSIELTGNSVRSATGRAEREWRLKTI
jgi:hypothetical protein